MSGLWGRVKLSPLFQKDIEKLRSVRNRERKWFINGGLITGEAQITWYDGYRGNPGDYMFTVSELANPEVFIGAAAIYNVDEEHKRAEFGRLIIDKTLAAGKGLGYDATVCACNIGFEQLGLAEIYLEVLSDNISALKTYIKAGFSETGSESGIIYMSKPAI